MTYKTVLFDVDGTLCDPGKSMIESARYALSRLGIDETDERKLNQLIGPPLEHAFRDYYHFNEVQTAQAVVYFRDMLQGEGMQLYEPYPGIPELLNELKQSGKRLAVVTSKIDHIAKDALAKTGLIDYFEFISARQPNIVVDKEYILSKALDELSITDASSVVMIGDRRHDVEAAKASNMDSIGVLWGYGNQEELENEGATYVVANADELKALLID